MFCYTKSNTGGASKYRYMSICEHTTIVMRSHVVRGRQDYLKMNDSGV
jgi:hypothetical protein